MRYSTLLAAIIVIALSLWLWSGNSDSPAETPAAATTKAEPSQRPMRVEYRDSQAEQVARLVVLQGQIEPFRSIELRAETEARVDTIAADKGDTVSAGDLLLTLETGERKARITEAEALLRQRESRLKGIKKLGQSSLSSENALREAEAELAAAEANLAKARLEYSRTRIHAPIAGTVDQRHVELGELLKNGDPILTLIDTSKLLATGQAPQLVVDNLHIGAEVKITTAARQELTGRITFISRVADAATRSFRIEAEIDNRELKLSAGVSATLAIPADRVRAHFVSPAHLTLGRSGSIGVYAIDDENRVHFHPVRLLRNASNGAWITGLPERLRIVTLGQGFLTEGQQVEPVVEQSHTDGTAEGTQ